MENNYIIVGINDEAKVVMSNNIKEILKNIKPKGCPFYNYSMFDLLCDWIRMYSWQIERNKKISLAEFVRKIKIDGKFIYKEQMIHIYESENM